MTKPNRPARIQSRRKSRSFEPRIKIYLVLEGEVTEKQYFQAVGRSNRQSNYSIQVVTPGSARQTLFDEATDLLARLKREAKKLGTGMTHSDVGQIWIVCDVDDEGSELRRLLDLRESKDIQWIISNPSFDAWLGMHFDKLITGYIERGVVQSKLKGMGVLTGANSKSIEMKKLEGRYAQAKATAFQCEKNHDGVTDFPQNNPSSDVHKLVDRLSADWK